jgi:GNAT superfamily N-acetyltransferase
MQMTIEIKSVSGAEIEQYFDDLARLRITVFREFPYLYDGNVEHEREYLSTYSKTDGSVIVLALDAGKVIGMSTGIPMVSETDEVKAPFLAAGYDINRIFYFGESVLDKTYRGQGIGVRFFEEREAHALKVAGQFDYCTFCVVERPVDHARRPSDYVPLNQFWNKRGYQHHPELFTTFTWQDLDETSKSPKKLSFWIREISQ